MYHSGLSIHPSIPTVLLPDQDKQVGKSFTRPVRGECGILQNGVAVHTCNYMSSSAVTYILSNINGHHLSTWTKGVQRSTPRQNLGI